MRNDQKYLEIINRNDQVEMTAFTAGYMAAMEVNHQYCPVQDSDFSSRILQSCIIECILAEIKMDEQQRRNMGKMVLNHFDKAEWTDHPEINCEDVKVDDSGNEVDGETSPKRDPRFYRTPDGRSIDTHDKSVQVVTDIAAKAIGTMLRGFAKAYDHSHSESEADNQTEGCTHDCMCKGDIFNNKQTCGACAQCQCGNEGSVDDEGIATL